jgi:hypothetical protein
VEQESEPQVKRDIVYYVVKTPPGIDNRDFLLERKVYNGFNADSDGLLTLIHYKSLTDMSDDVLKTLSPSFSQHLASQHGKVIRSETIISGYIIEQYGEAPDDEKHELNLKTSLEENQTSFQ